MALSAPFVSRLQAADLRLRTSLGYQWVRRVCLWGAVIFPAWLMLQHRARNTLESAGTTRQDGWAWLAGSINVGGAREGWTGAPWSMEVLGVEFLDPLAAASALLAGADPWHILIGVIPTLLLVVWLGRFFCGWLCPYALLVAASNALRALLARLGFTQRDVPIPEDTGFHVLAILLVAGALTGSQLAPLFYPPSIFHRELYKAIFQGSLGGGSVVLLLLFLFDTTVARAGFCRYLCPGGAMFRLLGRRSPVRVMRTASECTDCTACDVACNFLQSPMTDLHDSGCERCGRCVAVCPTGALRMEPNARLPIISSEGGH